MLHGLFTGIIHVSEKFSMFRPGIIYIFETRKNIVHNMIYPTLNFKKRHFND